MVGAERVVEEEVADPISFLAQYIVACMYSGDAFAAASLPRPLFGVCPHPAVDC